MSGCDKRFGAVAPVPAHWKRAVLHGACLALLGAPALALAQTAATQAGADEEQGASEESLAEVTVVGRAAPVPVEYESQYQPTPDASTLRSLTPALETPQVTNAVAAQVLRDQRPRHMDDALMNVSGITQGNTLAGTQDTILKRGFGGNRDGSIMHNGMPLVQGRGMNAAAESVVVLKGPSSMFYGIMDPGGVVNVVSKKPQLERRSALTLTGSSFGSGRHGGGLTLDTTGPIGEQGLAYRLIVDHSNEDYWRNFGKRRDTLLAPSLAWYGRDTQAVIWYEFRDYDVPFDRTVVLDPATKKPLNIPAERRLDEPFNQMWGKSHLLQSSVDHRIAPGWSAHASLSYNRETYDANQLRIQGVDMARGLVTRRADGTRGALSTDSYGTAYVDGSVKLGGMQHDMQFGMDAEYRRIYRANMIRAARTHTFSFLNPVYGQVQPSDRVVPSDSDQTDTLHNQSLFFQDAIHLNPQWIVIGGVRYLHWTQVAGRGRPFKANTNTRDGVWLPRLGLVYKIDATKSLYASYSRSVKPVSSIAPHESGMVIDSSIAPEKGVSWEIGAKLDTSGGLTGSLALFNINKENVLIRQYSDAIRNYEWRTAGAARSRGLELDLAGELNRQWSLIGSLAWLDAKVTQDPKFTGNRLANVARVTASVGGVFNAGDVGVGQLRLGARARYTGKRAGDSANAFWLPAYTVADVFATYDLPVAGRKMRLQFNIKNLTNKVYYPSANNQYGLAVGDARQFMLSAGFDF